MDATGTRLDTLAREQRVVPLLAHLAADALLALVDALAAGGMPCVELALRGDGALEHIATLRRERPDLLVGAGTVLTVEHWRAAERAGAAFVVSPAATEALLEHAARSPLPWLPGAQTPTELARLAEHGYRTVKLFPAEAAGGPAALRALADVFPELRFCPTGGVNAESLERYLALDAVPWVGGSWLADAELVAAGRWEAVAERARAARGS